MAAGRGLQTGAPGELLASTEDDPAGRFKAHCYPLTLSEAIERGICAPYPVVCVDITDARLRAAQLMGADGRSDRARGGGLAHLRPDAEAMAKVQDHSPHVLFVRDAIVAMAGDTAFSRSPDGPHVGG